METRGLASDNFAGAHPEVMEAVVAANGPAARRIRSATAELGMRTPCVALPVVGS